ncbi:MAG: hypothetical protein WBC18_27690, partial [Ottowia sp.]|uniref:hypothetical protein n=1 Tax=Ottowia sp. TaxID=1898956 RepID=UPI003C76F673
MKGFTAVKAPTPTLPPEGIGIYASFPVIPAQAGIQDYVALRQQKHSLCIPILPIPLQTMLGIR